MYVTHYNTLDIFSIVILTDTSPIEGSPVRSTHPMDGGIYVIPTSETVFRIRCYNLNNGSDTEITFANQNLAFHSISVFDTYSQAFFAEFPVMYNGNVSCRSPSTGQEITVFIASKPAIMYMCKYKIIYFVRCFSSWSIRYTSIKFSHLCYYG